MKRIIIPIFLAVATALTAIVVSHAASTSFVRSKSARLDDGFSVLGSAKLADSTSNTTLPALSVKHLSESGTLVAEYELEPAQARYIEINATTHAWVIPGRSGLCLAIPAFHGASIDVGCDSLARVNSGDFVMVRRPSSGPVIYGLVPNGASVTVTNQDSSSTGVPVTNNVFIYGDATAQSVSVQLGDGSVNTTTLAPE
jgi:hypothetical protein